MWPAPRAAASIFTHAWSAATSAAIFPAVQVMPGAGGIRAANYLAEQAPRDGTAITTFAGGPILEPLIGARNPGYDMSAFTWLGAMTKDIGLCIAWGES